MMLTPLTLADAAKSMIGVPFRLHGRDPEQGLDCIGIFAAALKAAGAELPLPNGYGLRMLCLPATKKYAAELGFRPCSGARLMGDVLIVQPGPAQFHLLIAVDRVQCVHAHAGLRRVVQSSLPDDWPVIEHWRLHLQSETD